MCRTDRECIEHCLDGHPDAYRHLVGRYQAVLVTYLAGHLGNREWAEEAAQEAFVRAYFALGKLRKPDSFFSWLLGIAGRVAMEQQRNERAAPSAITMEIENPGPGRICVTLLASATSATIAPPPHNEVGHPLTVASSAAAWGLGRSRCGLEHRGRRTCRLRS
ncbi:MAG: hypothetical protein GX616_20275 [Planctomycetes bacterium]|nr:hypothetical protein [Planctomycetota bacterium]